MTIPLRETKLPSVKHKVDDCPSCPLAHVEVETFGVPVAVRECGYPGDGQSRDVTDVTEGVPDFCPLARAPLLLLSGARP